ncbi:MAG: type 1 glutamine amidotransferase [Thermoleophilaceae bacterium]|nr:type 1 glutamine amidotransferase [Thermoleophilaceae bacterium]
MTRILSITHQPDARAGVFADVGAEIVEWVAPAGPPPPLDGLAAVMVFGGGMHVDQEVAHPWLRREKELLRELLGRGTPILGVCLGAQLLAEAAGAQPRRARHPEIGWHRVEVTAEGARDPLIGPLAPAFEAFEWHSYEAPLPPGGVALAHTPLCLQAFRVEGVAAWGVQFHAEVTPSGLQAWLDGWDADEDAAATGLDPEAIRLESRRKIAAQMELGRGVARRFLDEAAAG